MFYNLNWKGNIPLFYKIQSPLDDMQLIYLFLSDAILVWI